MFNAQLFFNEHYPDFNPGLWLTLCTIFGGTLGLLFGGYLSDMAVRSLGLHSRLWILSLTSFVAAPLSVGVLVMDTPYNFTFLLLYFFFGEFRKAYSNTYYWVSVSYHKSRFSISKALDK